jgi:hypothetical protein
LSYKLETVTRPARIKRRTATGTAAVITATRTGTAVVIVIRTGPAIITALRTGTAVIVIALRSGQANPEHTLPVPFPCGSSDGKDRNGQKQYGGKTFHDAKMTYSSIRLKIFSSSLFPSRFFAMTIIK